MSFSFVLFSPTYLEQNPTYKVDFANQGSPMASAVERNKDFAQGNMVIPLGNFMYGSSSGFSVFSNSLQF
jgi:hypothetical protein